jgi:hypothetical protein
MSVPNRQIGAESAPEEYWLSFISKQMERLTQVASNISGGGGGGTVSSFSSGNLSPLFTTSVGTPTTTPSLSFSLSNAGAHTWFGNNTGGSAAPSYTAAGNLTEATSAVLTITGSSTLLANTTIQVIQATTSTNGYLSSADWNTFNGKQSTGLSWLLASGGTLSGPNTIVGTTTNIIKYSFASLGTTVVDGAGLWFSNSTAAAAGAQQISPIITFEGQGWKTTGTASVQTLWQIYNLPVQGSANPTTNLIFQSKVAGSSTNGGLTLASDGAILLTQAHGLKINDAAGLGNVGGITLNGSSAVANQIQVNTGFIINQPSTWNATSGIGITINPGNTVTPTSGAITGSSFAGFFSPASGTAAFTAVSITTAINQTGGSNGSITYLDINPAIIAVVGIEYGLLVRRGITSLGAGATPANALAVIGAGTTILAPLKFTSGTNLTTAVAGCMEYDGTNLFFTRTGTTREGVITESAVNVVSPTAQNRTITVNIGGTTYFLTAKTTND